MEGGLALTKEAVMALNNHSVTFEHARSLFHHVDLPTFKAKLLEFNILVWNEPSGKQVRIHGGDHGIVVAINKLRYRSYGVKGTETFSDVQNMIEDDLSLTPGNYELTYEDPKTLNWNVLKTDLDWHHAVRGSEAGFVRLNLEAKDKHIAIYKAAYDDEYDPEYADGFVGEYADEYDGVYAGEYADTDEYADKDASASHLAILNLG